MKIVNISIFFLVCVTFALTVFLPLFFPKYALAVVVLGLLIFSLIFSKRIHRSWLSPLGLFSLGWLAPALFNFLYGFYDPFWRIQTPLTWLIIISTWLFFFLAYFLTLLIFKKDNSLQRPTVFSLWSKKQFKFILYFLFCIGFTAAILSLWRAFGTLNLFTIFPLYLKGFRIIERMWAGNPILNYFFFLNGFTFILGLVYLFVYGKEKKIIGITFFSLAILFLLPIKTHIIQPLVIGAIILLILGFRPKLQHLILGTALLVFIFLVIDVGRALFEFEEDLTIKEALSLSVTFFKRIPLYMVPNYPNLEKELLHRNFIRGEGTGGLLTFGVLLDMVKYFFTGERLIQRGDPGRTVFGGIELNLVKEGHNIGTFLREPFLDWGVGALIFLPMVLAAISTFSYLFFLFKKDLLSLFLFGLISYVLLFAWWNLKLFEIRFLWWGALMFLFYFLNKPTKKIQTQL